MLYPVRYELKRNSSGKIDGVSFCRDSWRKIFEKELKLSISIPTERERFFYYGDLSSEFYLGFVDNGEVIFVFCNMSQSYVHGLKFLNSYDIEDVNNFDFGQELTFVHKPILMRRVDQKTLLDEIMFKYPDVFLWFLFNPDVLSINDND